MTTLYKSSFNAGVLSPRTGGRIDLAKYESALGMCDNALPQPWGGVTRRMGTEFINECSTMNKRSRLVPFKYSTEQAYMLEVGDSYTRFYMDGGLIQGNDASTLALLHCNGHNGSQVFTDNSTYNKVVTAGGNAKIDDSDGVFSQCVVLDGDDYLSMADSADWNRATLPITDEFRIKMTTLPANGEIVELISQRADADNYAVFFLKNIGGVYTFSLEFRESGISTLPIENMTWTGPTINSWGHIALIRNWGLNPNLWTVTVDGVSVGTRTSTAVWPNIAAVLKIGCGQTGNISAYPPDHSDAYVKATSKGSTNYWPYLATDPSQDLIDNSLTHSWVSVAGSVTDQRFHIDIGAPQIVKSFYYENYHDSGGSNTIGVKTFTLQGSNAEADFLDIYNYATVGNWVTINTSTDKFSKHPALNAVDPQYISLTNVASYRYYGFKFADNWTSAGNMGFRRLELNTCTGIGVKGKMDEIRLSKQARWTANFTPPTVAYPLGTSGGNTDYSVSSAYVEGDLRDIYYTQSADTLYLAHPDHKPKTLVRVDHDDWTLTDIDFAWPPFMNTATTSKTLTPSGFAAGPVWITASASTFDDTYVGSSLKIESGYMNIASVQSATRCSGTIIAALGTASKATSEWYKSAWDDVSGYPSCVTFFEQRLSYAATDAEEQTIWMSVSGDFYNHNQRVGGTITDTDACVYTIDADEVNRVHFLSPAKKLVAGTEGGIFMISGNNDDGVTPSNIKIRVEAAEQAADEVMPVKFGNSVLFTERGKKIIREFAYNFQSDSYEAKDLIILAEHLTRNNTIMEMALQRIPFKVIWCVLDDGKVISLTYLKEHDVIGWTIHDFGGVAESVAVIPGDTDDEVWFIMKRTVSGTVVRYIERLKPNFTGESEEDAFYVDSGLTYDSVPTTSISGLTHLTGETVMFFANGNINTATVVNSSGQIFLGGSYSTVQVGLPVTTEIETLRVSPAQSQGKPKRISYVTVRFFETAGEVKLGVSGKMDTLNLGTNLFTGDYKFTFPSGYDDDGKIRIQKTDSFPMTILAIIPDIEMYRG
jgi:hypothetical protein